MLGKSPADRAYAKRWQEKPRGRANMLLRKLRRRCTEKGFDQPSIPVEWLVSRLERGTCELSGVPFKRKAGTRSPFSASVDRINCALGYTPENCRVILWALNAAFAEWGEDAFAEIAQQWLAHRGKGLDLI